MSVVLRFAEPCGNHYFRQSKSPAQTGSNEIKFVQSFRSIGLEKLVPQALAPSYGENARSFDFFNEKVFFSAIKCVKESKFSKCHLTVTQ